MAAVYPNQYRSFTPHKNIVEDVDASHVNNLQDELAAIQQTLGLNPHQDTGLKMSVNTWSSVAARLDAIQRGRGVPVAYLEKASDSMKGVTGTATKYISWPAPIAGHDPEGLFDGKSIRTNRAGWWLIFARVIWTGALGSLATGPDREISIAYGDGQVMTQDLPPISDGNTHMHIGFQGFAGAGTQINLGIFHPLIGKTLSVEKLHLSASMIREA